MRGGADESEATNTLSIVDPVAFERCFVEHFAPIHRFIARRVGTSLADDLAADTFTTAYRRRDTFDPLRGTQAAWLFGIATNLIRNHWRAEQRSFQRDSRLFAEQMATGHESLSDERLSSTSASARLAEALGALNHEQRDVLFLHAWAQLSHDEIAAALTIPLGTVRSRLSRARSTLVKRLEGFDFDLWEYSNVAPISTAERIEHD